MLNQSKKILPEEYAPIPLDPAFPIRRPDQTLRGTEPEIPPHVHDCFEIGYCHEGTGLFVIENKIFSFLPGDAVVINQQELHILRSIPGCTTKWDFTNFDPVAMLAGAVTSEEKFLNPLPLCGSGFKNIISHRQHPDICRTILEIISELHEQKNGYQSLIRSLVWTLMVKLHRLPDTLPPQESNRTLPERSKLERVKPAMKYIAANYAEKIEIGELASRCNSSISNFRKLFHASLGCSPQGYIHKLRMKMAAVLLANSAHSVNRIALDCGFQSLSNFNRQFKEYHGAAPGRWRLEHKK